MNFLKLNILTRIRDARSEPESGRSLARAYWTVLILVFLSAAGASIVFGVYEFTRPLTPPESEVVVGAGAKAPLNRAQLRAILDDFDARTEQFDERRATPLVRDPF